MPEYKWKDGTVTPLDPQVAGDELERIRQANGGRLDPAAVVRASRRRSAPLHAHFEWDDTAAARKHRETQAAYLIRHVVVEYEDLQQEPREVRAFVNVRIEDERRYTDIVTALSDDELRQQLLDRAMREHERWQRQYETIVELAPIFRAAKRVKTAKKKIPAKRQAKQKAKRMAAKVN